MLEFRTGPNAQVTTLDHINQKRANKYRRIFFIKYQYDLNWPFFNSYAWKKL